MAARVAKTTKIITIIEKKKINYVEIRKEVKHCKMNYLQIMDTSSNYRLINMS